MKKICDRCGKEYKKDYSCCIESLFNIVNKLEDDYKQQNKELSIACIALSKQVLKDNEQCLNILADK